MCVFTARVLNLLVAAVRVTKGATTASNTFIMYFISGAQKKG